MTDVEAIIRSWLAAIAAITALTGQRIYADTELPPTYAPADGPAILLIRRGGGQDESGHVLRPSIQFRCYGETTVLARQLDRTLFDGINDQRYGSIKWSRCEVQGQLVRDPATGWPYVISFYTFHVGN